MREHRQLNKVRKIHEQNKNISKDRKYKKEPSKSLKNTVSELKKSVVGFNKHKKTKQNNQLNDRSFEMIELEE